VQLLSCNIDDHFSLQGHHYGEEGACLSNRTLCSIFWVGYSQFVELLKQYSMHYINDASVCKMTKTLNPILCSYWIIENLIKKTSSELKMLVF